MESRISVGPIPVTASIWNGTLVLPKSNPIKLWKVSGSSDFQSFLSVSVKTVSGSVLREAEKNRTIAPFIRAAKGFDEIEAIWLYDQPGKPLFNIRSR
ncbi:MAG TPA: hypothetical protein DCM60_07530 [Nitrospina sp.]|nr:hypothetical protein [Nitrospina sp.]